ncbi:hypothetical protein, partial [Paenibacillus sp. CFBP 13594]|uniref:hypothetical protein n=1 Tax=Paenibacillus sp. CFBP 13594 TaxID=2774037 RepID=UPI001A7E384C
QSIQAKACLNFRVHSASRMFTHSLFSFQRSNIQFSAVFHVVVVSAATFIIYHVEVLFASIIFSIIFNRIIFMLVSVNRS